MKNFIAKYGPVIGVIVVVLMVLFVVKLQYDASVRDDAINKSLVEMKELQDGIVRSQARYASKEDIEDFAKANDLNLDEIKKDLDKLDAELIGVGRILATSIGRKQTGVGSSWTTTRPTGPNDPPVSVCEDPSGESCYPDPYGYQSNSQHLGLSEPFANGEEVAIGNVTFDAWKEKPWSLEVHPREYKVLTTLGKDEDGRHYVHNKFTISADGSTHEIPIEESELLEKYPDPSFHFNPNIHLGFDGGAVVNEPLAEVVPSAKVFLFSYGKTKAYEDTQWSFLGIGVGYGTQHQTFNAVLTPVTYNLGRHIPLMNNLHIGPTVSVDSKKGVFVGGGISVGM